MRGEREKDLKGDLRGELTGVVDQIKALYGEIFAHPAKVATELGAYKALGRIIKALCLSAQQLTKTGEYEASGFLAQRCLELAWGKKYATENEKESYEWWLHQVMDYVSGLTDNYARQLSREIEGT
jgi:dGTPase